MAGLGDLTSRIGGDPVAMPKARPDQPTARRATAVEEQLEGLAELAAELDLGLPGTSPQRSRAGLSPAGNGVPHAAVAGPAPAERPAARVPTDATAAGREPPPTPRTLTEPAPGVLILSRPRAGRSEVGGRPWSPAAAMEPLPPLAPPAPPPRRVTAPTELVGDPEQLEDGGRGLRLPLALAAGTALLVAVIIAGVLLLVGHKSAQNPERPLAHPSPAPAPAGFHIDGLRTVSAAASDPFTAPTQTSFLEGGGSIVVAVTYHGADPGTPLGINLSRLTAPGQPATPVLDTSYILNPAPTGEGQNAIVVATPLSQGHYLLRASYAGQAAFSGEFDVLPAPPPPTPTPARR
ncbi:MAG: hypothetical protein NVSMB29_01780 [Candidatus Dormibacteria bacterium]